MPYTVADAIYDRTHTWQNANDRVAFERAFAVGTMEERKIALAVLTASPQTPEAFISAELTVPGVPPRYGYDDEPYTISDMFTEGIPRIPQAGYSGTSGSYTGSDRNVTVFN